MKFFLLFIFNCFIFVLLHSQSGSVDMTFAPLDEGLLTTEGFNHNVYTTFEQTDGKVIVGGSFTKFNQFSTNRIVRLNHNGSYDSTFNVGSGFYGQVHLIDCQEDGKILVAGSFTAYNGSLANRLIRLNPDGTRDSTFLFSDFAPNMIEILSLKILQNGKIMIGGYFQLTYNGITYSNILRLNSDGTIDPSFAIGYGFNSSVRSITVDNDSKMFIGGNFTLYDSIQVNRIIKLNYDGSIDATFNSGLGFTSEISKIIRQSDQKLIITTGNLNSYNGNQTNKLVRLYPNGDIDLSFISPFTGPSPSQLNDICLTANNKIFCVGFLKIDTITSCVFLLNPNGSRDSTFMNYVKQNMGTFKNVNCFNANTYIGGDFISTKNLPKSFLCRLIDDTLIDNAFISKIGANSYATDIKVQSNGKIILIGTKGILSQYGNNYVPGLFRINDDGTFDSTFVLNHINVPLSTHNKILLFNNDKIVYIRDLANSLFTSLSPKFIRLEADGEIDLSFDTTFVINFSTQYPYKVLPLSDGSFLHNIYGQYAPEFRKVLGNGLEDQSFNNTGNLQNVYDFCELPDSRIVYVTSYELGFLSSSGIELSSISISNGKKVVSQSDNKLIVVNSSTFNSTVVRYDQNNEIDSTFQLDTSIVKVIANLIVLPNDKIIAYGDLHEDDGILNNIVFRLNANGSVDTSFYIGAGANSEIMCMSLDQNGDILISGDFNSYNGIGRNRIARINNGLDVHISDTITNCSSSGFIWAENGQTYTVSGTYYDTIITPEGYNKFLQLNLQISSNSFSIDYQYACADFIWIDGITYTTSNSTATYILPNANGCDSTITLNLTINSPSTGIDTITSCGSYTWIDGNTYTASNSTATHVLQNVNSCDSTITLNLTINSPSTGIDTITSCDSYTWIDGNTYTASNSTATHILPNVSGCDSTITLNLTINSPSTGIETISSCDSYTWIDGNTYTASNSTATYILPTANGCDSTITLNLTINSPSTGIETISSCDSYTWIDGNTYTASNSTATHILPNVNGCDSIITLNLTITQSQSISNSVFVSPSDPNLCTGNAAVSISGSGPFEIEIDDDNNVIPTNGFTEISDLCAGIHTMKITTSCDTIVDEFIIPVEANYVFNNGFPNSTAVDSIGILVENCEIDYTSISAVYIDSLWVAGDTVHVIWNVEDINGSNYDTLQYILSQGEGIYYLQYSFYCPNKDSEDYFTASEAIYFGNGSASTTSVIELQKLWLNIYPNPTNSNVTIQMNESEGNLKVFDVQGKLILNQKIQNQDDISLKNMQDGVYLFEVQTTNNKTIQRIIKY